MIRPFPLTKGLHCATGTSGNLSPQIFTEILKHSTIPLTCANQEIKVPSDLVTFDHLKLGNPEFKSLLRTCELHILAILSHPSLLFKTCIPLTYMDSRESRVATIICHPRPSSAIPVWFLYSVSLVCPIGLKRSPKTLQAKFASICKT